METKRNEQKWFIWNSKFGKHFYALVLGLALALSGWFYFLVSAWDLTVDSNLENAYQTIGSVKITQDGTPSWDPYFYFNSDGKWWSIFYQVPNWTVTIQKYLWLDSSNKLIYTTAWVSNDDGDRNIAGSDIYRLTWNVSIWTDVTDFWGKLNIVSSETGNPELYVEQTSDSAANIWLKTISNRWTVWAYGITPDDYFFIAVSWSLSPFTIEPNWDTSIRGDLYMFDNDIKSVGNITSTGNVTAVAFILSSDKNLKKNIKIIENPLDKIYALNWYTFDWKKDWTHSVGLIAQEVEKVFPELVKVNKDTWMKWVEYQNMVALLIEWIKELWNRIDGLYNKYLDQQAQIDALELRIKKLEIR